MWIFVSHSGRARVDNSRKKKKVKEKGNKIGLFFIYTFYENIVDKMFCEKRKCKIINITRTRNKRIAKQIF